MVIVAAKRDGKWQFHLAGRAMLFGFDAELMQTETIWLPRSLDEA
jgi:hypothetical protein